MSIFVVATQFGGLRLHWGFGGRGWISTHSTEFVGLGVPWMSLGKGRCAHAYLATKINAAVCLAFLVYKGPKLRLYEHLCGTRVPDSTTDLDPREL